MNFNIENQFDLCIHSKLETKINNKKTNWNWNTLLIMIIWGNVLKWIMLGLLLDINRREQSNPKIARKNDKNVRNTFKNKSLN